MKNSRILIAFFSRAGNNYVGGSVVNLKVGNTETVARTIKDMTGGDLFKIETVESYPDDYTETTEVAKRELNQNARPELKEKLGSIDRYDTIILGYQNWWVTMPMAVRSFLESCDLSGKTILPLCTHEGSGMGRSESDLRRLCPGAKVLSGLAIVGGSVLRSDHEIGLWLRKHRIIGQGEE
jgi:flavodoxin